MPSLLNRRRAEANRAADMDYLLAVIHGTQNEIGLPANQRDAGEPIPLKKRRRYVYNGCD